MTTTTNAEKVWQYKSRFSLIVEQTLAFLLSNNFIKVKEFVSKFQMNYLTVSYVVDNFHLYREIHFIIKF